MNKILTLLLFAACVCLFPSCQKATPQETFDRAVLNTNLLQGFAGSGMKYQLDHPSVKLDPASGKTAPMMRKEIVEDKIRSIDEASQKVGKLSETEDNRDMVRASIALYEYVLPVYRNEYVQLAGLYDSGAAKADIDAALKSIADKYLKGYQERTDALLTAGRPFAERHGINVKWDVRTSPSP
jgi:hypothetical protein